MKRSRRQTLSPLQKMWQSWLYEITLPGKLLIGGFLFSGMGTISVQVPIYQIFCGLATLLAVAMFTGIAFRPRVSISGRFPERTTVGEEVTANLTVTGTSRIPSLDVTLGFFHLPDGLGRPIGEQTAAVLRRGESAELAVTLVPRRRGHYELPPLRAFTTFPFNLFCVGTVRHPLPPLLVFPRFHSLAELRLPASARYQPRGVLQSSRVGESPEYIGNREYIAGEPIRRVDFRSWARLGKPVVREYQEEYFSRIALVLDTFVPELTARSAAGFLPLEAGVSLTAALAERLTGGDHVLELFAAGPLMHVFRFGRGETHFAQVLEILAAVDSCPENPFETMGASLEESLSALSCAVCVMLDWDDARSAFVRSLIEGGCNVRVLLVRDGSTTRPIDSTDGCEITRVLPNDVVQGRVVQV